MKKDFVIFSFAVIAALCLAGCNNDDSGHQIDAGEGDLNLPPLDMALVAEGQNVFRYETFGDESFWTDVLQMNQVVEAAVDPVTALAVGLKVDANALPPEVVAAIQNGEVDLTDPQTTLILLSLNAVVGVKGQVSLDAEGVYHLDRMGITCALCHSTVDDSFAPGIGSRLDGYPNRDLNPGLIISLSPALDQPTKDIYASWVPENMIRDLIMTEQAIRLSYRLHSGFTVCQKLSLPATEMLNMNLRVLLPIGTDM